MIIQLFKFKIILNDPSDLEVWANLFTFFMLTLLNNSFMKKIFYSYW